MRRCALVVFSARTRQGHRSGERSLSFGMLPWCDVLAVVTQNQPVFAFGTRGRATVLAASREVAKHASLLMLRARRAALVVDGRCTIKGHCTGERPLSFGARPWSDVPAAVW